MLTRLFGIAALGTAAIVAASAKPSLAGTDGMRCGQRLVSSGDSTYQVRSLCGEPAATDRRVETRVERRRVRGPCFKDQSGQLRCERDEAVSIDVVIDDWTYDFGPRRFVHYLTFENGKLVRVATGGYGNVGAKD
jgi:hypothetical protein